MLPIIRNLRISVSRITILRNREADNVVGGKRFHGSDAIAMCICIVANRSSLECKFSFVGLVDRPVVTTLETFGIFELTLSCPGLGNCNSRFGISIIARGATPL